MHTRSTTRPLPAAVLITVPTIAWVALIAVTWVEAAEDQTPSGGWFSLGIALAVTATFGSLLLWAHGDGKTHTSSELATCYSVLSRRMDIRDADTAPLPRLRVVGSATVETKVDPAEDAEALTGYAKGYADGLSRRPIAGKVLPIDGPRNSS